MNNKGEIIDRTNKIHDADVLQQKVVLKENTNLFQGIKKIK